MVSHFNAHPHVTDPIVEMWWKIIQNIIAWDDKLCHILVTIPMESYSPPVEVLKKWCSTMSLVCGMGHVTFWWYILLSHSPCLNINKNMVQMRFISCKTDHVMLISHTCHTPYLLNILKEWFPELKVPLAKLVVQGLLRPHVSFSQSPAWPFLFGAASSFHPGHLQCILKPPCACGTHETRSVKEHGILIWTSSHIDPVLSRPSCKHSQPNGPRGW